MKEAVSATEDISSGGVGGVANIAGGIVGVVANTANAAIDGVGSVGKTRFIPRPICLPNLWAECSRSPVRQ
jgi:hypothetical protein